MSALVDLTGRRFYKWTVLNRHDAKCGQALLWVCVCDCGVKRPVLGNSLRRGKSTNCGCIQYAQLSIRQRKHGYCERGHNSRAYTLWRHINQRCYNPRCKDYPYYGGRGIAVCDRWRSFESFYADVGDPPPDLTLDREDNDGDYEPGNWRWATRYQQAHNRRKPKKTGPMPSETRAKLSAALKGRIRSPEHCANISAAKRQAGSRA
jgi:hypothetical protein